MISFLKSYNYNTLSKKLKIIYTLNVLDIIFTLILIKTGLFEEGNLFMISIVNNPFLSLLLKVVFIYIIIKVLIYRMKEATKKQLRISNYLILPTLILYSLINVSHIVYSIIAVSIYVNI